MKKEWLKTFVIVSVLLVATIGMVSAGIVVDVTSVKDTVAPGETATYIVNVTSITTESEEIVLLIDDPTPGWGFNFNPNNYIIGPGDSVYSDLDITVPSDAAVGEYYHTVNATAYDPILGEWLGVIQFTIYTNVPTTVIPEFTTIAIPVAAIFGLFLLIRRRKQR
jgi:uncharacterized membrane protein